MKKIKMYASLGTLSSKLVALLLIMCCAYKVDADPLLNGVATHIELGKEQFVAGLFTSALSSSVNSILTSREDKRLQVRVLAPQLSSRRFKRMWIEGIAINSSPAELQKHARNMANYSNMLKIKMVRGDIFTIDRSADTIKVSVNGSILGEIDDPQFFDLLLRTWIGPVPLSSDFRSDLLAEGSIKPDQLARFEATRPSDERIASIERALAARRDDTEAPKVAAVDPQIVAPQINVPRTAPLEVAAPVDKEPQISIKAPSLAPLEVKPTVTPTPTPQKIALAPQEEALDESIFEDDTEEEFTAESLLKEQLYYSQLASYTHRFLKYPPRAWDRGREGNIRLRVTINRNGYVKKTELLEKAEHRSLNREAESAVDRADPYPSIPDYIKGDEYTFTFRVAFKIVGD